MALRPARCGAVLWADCADLGRVEYHLGVAAAACRGYPGAKAGTPGGFRQRLSYDRRLDQRLLRIRQLDGSVD